jgi:predicted AlkP superfamily pyrophosphatase or phosphodiesterase
VYRKSEIPARLHYGSNRRVAPIIGIADPGWSITTRQRFASEPQRFDGGNHGFDPADPGMRGIFIARGPAFRRGLQAEAFENVHVYSLIMEILGLPPAPSDGSLEAVRHLLVPG